MAAHRNGEHRHGGPRPPADGGPVRRREQRERGREAQGDGLVAAERLAGQPDIGAEPVAEGHQHRQSRGRSGTRNQEGARHRQRHEQRRRQLGNEGRGHGRFEIEGAEPGEQPRRPRCDDRRQHRIGRSDVPVQGLAEAGSLGQRRGARDDPVERQRPAHRQLPGGELRRLRVVVPELAAVRVQQNRGAGRHGSGAEEAADRIVSVQDDLSRVMYHEASRLASRIRPACPPSDQHAMV
jgi:hypothetical protein